MALLGILHFHGIASRSTALAMVFIDLSYTIYDGSHFHIPFHALLQHCLSKIFWELLSGYQFS